MTFRELLEKYKQGTLTEEEKLLVESELEKNEAINDYLAENLDLNNICDDNSTTATNSTTKKIKHTVNLKLAKIVAISVALVFAIIFATKYIVSPLVASRYYNPTKKTITEFRTDFYYDMRALTEVTLPGYNLTSSTFINDLGFGNYKLLFSRLNSFNMETETSDVELKKNNKISSNFEAFYGRSYIMWPSLLGMSEKDTKYKDALIREKKQSEERFTHLKELPSSTYVSAFVILNNSLSMKELSDLVYNYNNIDFEWTAIKVSDESISTPIGFRLNTNRDTGIKDEAYYDKYPALTLGDYFANSKLSSSDNWLSTGYELHFTTLMKYLYERPDAVSTLSYNNLDFKGYLKYIEENGINTSGILIYAEVDDLLSFCENEDIQVINIDNVLPSKYSNSNKF